LSAGPRRRQDGHVADLQLAGDAVPIVDRLTSVPDVAPGHRILGAPGADWPDVVRFAWYVLDASSVQVIRDVREEFIRGPLGGQPNPASTLVQVAALFRPGLLVEVDAVVAVPG
jgi:hypothetical protein